jgi:hypothetical protein
MQQKLALRVFASDSSVSRLTFPPAKLQNHVPLLLTHGHRVLGWADRSSLLLLSIGAIALLSRGKVLLLLPSGVIEAGLWLTVFRRRWCSFTGTVGLSRSLLGGGALLALLVPFVGFDAGGDEHLEGVRVEALVIWDWRG